MQGTTIPAHDPASIGRIEALDTGPAARALIAATRVAIAMMWIQNLNWKIPPDFGRDRHADLYVFVQDAVGHPVFAPYSWLVEHAVLPHFTAFGYLTLLTEFGLGVFLLVGLLTRLWAVIGIAQVLAIALSVLNTPGEWHWSYFLMLAGHVALLATAAGRAGGLDGILRPAWRASPRRWARWAVIAS